MENLYIVAIRENGFIYFFLCDDMWLVDFWVEAI